MDPCTGLTIVACVLLICATIERFAPKDDDLDSGPAGGPGAVGGQPKVGG